MASQIVDFSNGTLTDLALVSPSGITIDASGLNTEHYTLYPNTISAASEWRHTANLVGNTNAQAEINTHAFTSAQYIAGYGWDLPDGIGSVSNVKIKIKAFTTEGTTASAKFYLSDSYDAAPSTFGVALSTEAVDDGTTGGTWFELDLPAITELSDLSSKKLYVQRHGGSSGTATSPLPEFYISRMVLEFDAIYGDYLVYGQYLSEWFGDGAAREWEKIDWTATIPSDCSIETYIRVSDEAVEADREEADWIKVWERSVEPRNVFENAKYLQFKMFLAGTPSIAPVVHDTTLGYNALTNTTAPTLTVNSVYTEDSSLFIDYTVQDPDGLFFLVANENNFRYDVDDHLEYTPGFLASYGLTSNDYVTEPSGMMQNSVATSGNYLLEWDLSDISVNGQYSLNFSVFDGKYYSNVYGGSLLVNIAPPVFIYFRPGGDPLASGVDLGLTGELQPFPSGITTVFDNSLTLPKYFECTAKAFNKNIDVEQTRVEIQRSPSDDHDFQILSSRDYVIDGYGAVEVDNIESNDENGTAIFRVFFEDLTDGIYHFMGVPVDKNPNLSYPTGVLGGMDSLTGDLDGVTFEINSQIYLNGNGDYNSINLYWSEDLSAAEIGYDIYRTRLYLNAAGQYTAGTYTNIASVSGLNIYVDNSPMLKSESEQYFRYYIVSSGGKISNTIDLTAQVLTDKWTPKVHSGYFYTVDKDGSDATETQRAISSTDLAILFDNSDESLEYIDGYQVYNRVNTSAIEIVRTSPQFFYFKLSHHSPYAAISSSFSNSKITVEDDIHAITSAGGTATITSIMNTIITAFASSTRSKRAVVYSTEVSDAINESLLNQIINNEIVVDVVGIETLTKDLNPESPLSILAQRTGGQYYVARTSGDIVAVAKSVLDNIRGRFSSDAQVVDEYYLYSQKAVERVETATDRYKLASLPQHNAPIIVSEYSLVNSPTGHLPSGFIPEDVPWARTQYPKSFRKVQQLTVTDTTTVNIDGGIDLRDEDIYYDPGTSWLENLTTGALLNGYIPISGNKIYLPSEFQPEDEVELTYKLDRSFQLEYATINGSTYAYLNFDKQYAGLYIEYETGETQYYTPRTIDISPYHVDVNTGFLCLAPTLSPVDIELYKTQDILLNDGYDKVKVIATVIDENLNRREFQQVEFTPLVGMEINTSLFYTDGKSIIDIFDTVSYLPKPGGIIVCDNPDITPTIEYTDAGGVAIVLEATNKELIDLNIPIVTRVYYESDVARNSIKLFSTQYGLEVNNNTYEAATSLGQAVVMLSTTLEHSLTVQRNISGSWSSVDIDIYVGIYAQAGSAYAYIGIPLNEYSSAQPDISLWDIEYPPFMSDYTLPKKPGVKDWSTTIFDPTEASGIAEEGWIASNDMITTYYKGTPGALFGDSEAFDLSHYNASGVWIG